MQHNPAAARSSSAGAAAAPLRSRQAPPQREPVLRPLGLGARFDVVDLGDFGFRNTAALDRYTLVKEGPDSVAIQFASGDALTLGGVGDFDAITFLL